MITILVGTNRPGSNTRKLATIVAKIYEQLKVPTRILDLAELPAEIFSPTSYGTKPSAFQPFSDAILNTTGIVLISPEYNGGPPGVLKYFIDMLKFPESFERRPVCFIGLSAGIWGGLRPVEQLEMIFGYRNAYIYPERVFVPGVYEVIAEDGTIPDADLRGRLEKQAVGFSQFVAKVSAT